MSFWTIFLSVLCAVIISRVKNILRIISLCRSFKNPPWRFPDGNLLEMKKKFKDGVDALLAYQKQYGLIHLVWFGWNHLLVTSDNNHFKQVLVSRKADWEVGARIKIKQITGNSLFTANAQAWQHKRKTLNTAFGFTNLQKMVTCFYEPMRQLMSICEEESANTTATPLNLQILYSRMTIEVIAKSAFGIKVLDSSLVQNFNTILGMTTKWYENFIPFSWSENWRKRQNSINHVRPFMVDVVKDRILKYQETKTTENDLLGILINAKFKYDDKKESHNEKELNSSNTTIMEIIDESMAFILAGHETTSTFMTWFTYILAKHPKVDEKLYQELKNSSAQLLSTETEKVHLPYFDAIVEETFRMFPPAAILDRVSIRDTKIDDFFIPKGTTLLLNIIGLHHNEEYWEKPYQFMPERFLNNHPNEKNRSILSPFSRGVRRCIGQEFARLEIKTILPRIFLKYRFTLAPEFQKIPNHDAKDIEMVMRPRHPILVNVHRR